MEHVMALLIDGAFYLKRAKSLRGHKDPKSRADELVGYCRAHARHEHAEVYRIFYYDCDPIDKKAYHPLLDRTVDLKRTDDYKWKKQFFDELARKRKVAIRKGQPLEGSAQYVLKDSAARELVRGKKDVESLKESDFVLDVQQKGVDVRMGLDLALISHERFANQIVLVTGDSDFVPAAKYARRHGIDVILDPMWHDFRPELGVHTDGMHTPWPRPKRG